MLPNQSSYSYPAASCTATQEDSNELAMQLGQTQTFRQAYHCKAPVRLEIRSIPCGTLQKHEGFQDLQ